jgi:flagellum-specific ATP synthase
MIFSMPLGSIDGITSGQRVYSTGSRPSVEVGHDFLGRVINGLGKPIDNKGTIKAEATLPIYRKSVNAMQRENIREKILTGIKAVDGLISIGKGQRMGIFSGSGVGKSTLMGMIARNTNADINVISLVGERGRELKDFIEKSLGPEGLSRSVVVAATSDEPPLIKINSAFLATSIAEYFSDQGKDVLLMMDSITRLSMAQREVGLSIGEPPSSKGYTPSVFTMMPKLLERSGNFMDKGSITGIYTVLVEGDDISEPISDHARSILDGHIVLSRDLAHKNQFPAIDVLESVSRVSSDITDPEHIAAAGGFRELLAVFREAEDLINIGAYVKGSNPKIDLAISKIEEMRGFLKQGINEKVDFDKSLEQLKRIGGEGYE